MARASAAEKGKGPAKKRGAKRGADDALSLAELLARCTRADLETLLLEHQDDLPDLQAAVEAKLQPEQVRRASGARGPPAAACAARYPASLRRAATAASAHGGLICAMRYASEQRAAGCARSAPFRRDSWG